MRSRRRVVLGFAALGASWWTACTTFDAATTPDVDAGAPIDATAVDAGIDDASLDCANAVICDDFEQPGDATTGWPSAVFTQSVTFETTTEEAKSPTHALKASATSSTTRRQAFVRTGAFDPANVSVEFALLARAPLASYVNVVTLGIGTTGDHYFNVQLAEDGTMHLYEQRSWPDGGSSFSPLQTIPTVRSGQWRDVRAAVTHAPDGGVQATLRVDGTTVAVDGKFGSSPKTVIQVGLVYSPAGDNSLSVYLDDIVVRAE